MTDDEISALSTPDQWPGHFSTEERIVLDFATRLATDSDDLGAELTERLTTTFDERQLAEIILIGGLASMSNRSGAAARQLLGRR